jgi:hypothetical protein
MRRLIPLLAAVSLGAGCVTVTSKVPGVLDLRSDGADAPVNTGALPPPRSGFDSFAYGEGVKGGADVVIEDRSHFLLAFMPIFNDSSTEEWRTAIGDQALRNVAITEQYGVMTWAVAFVKGLIPAVGGLISGTWDFRARGTRILASGGSVREESIPPPPATDTAVSPGVGY